jgi:hypothetical protein
LKSLFNDKIWSFLGERLEEMADVSSQEKLADNVSLLIEAVSNLVLCTITGEMGDIQANCASLAEYTQKVVLQAKDIAVAARHKDTTKEITTCTNAITSTIESLINSFISLLSAFTDLDAKKNFAITAKNVGMAINDLIVAADTAASRKVIQACEEAQELQKQVLRQIPAHDQLMLEASRIFGESAVYVYQQSSAASIHSADKGKASLLSHSANLVEEAMKEFLRVADAVHVDPSDSENKNEMAAQYKGLIRIFTDLIEAASIVPDFSGDINDAFDRFNKMLDLAKALRQAADALYDAVCRGVSLDEFQRMAKEALQSCMDLIAQALKVLENEKDPIRREQIQNSINDTKTAVGAFVSSAKDAQASPGNASLIEVMKGRKEAFDGEVTKLVALTSKNMEEEKLWYTARWLESVCEEMIAAAPNASAEDLTYYADRIAAITERVSKDAKAVAMKTNDPQKRDDILNAVGDLGKAGDRYIGDLRNLSRKPKDPQLLARLGITHKMFNTQIHRVLAAAGLEEAREEEGVSHNDGDSDLVRAAKEQAMLALQMVKDALAMAEQLTDPVKKQLLIDAALRLKGYAGDVIRDAEAAAADPKNLEKQIQLDESQRLLADGIREVVMLTSSVAGDLKALMDSMANDDDVDIASLFALAEKLMREITRFVETVSTTEAKEVVLKAKELALDTNTLSGMIRKVIDQTPDPRSKEQLTGLARFMRDRATQVKMIAAVKVACGGDGGQVTSAADGLKSTIGESVSVLRVSELKRRRTRTTGRAAEIRKVMEMWQKSMNASR